MSIDAKIVTALKPLGYDVVKNVYQGEAEEYIVFNYDTYPYFPADDFPEMEKHLVQVHLFAKSHIKLLNDIKAVKKALVAAGFDYPQVIDASESEWQNIVFEFDYYEGIDDGDF